MWALLAPNRDFNIRKFRAAKAGSTLLQLQLRHSTVFFGLQLADRIGALTVFWTECMPGPFGQGRLDSDFPGSAARPEKARVGLDTDFTTYSRSTE